MSVLMSQANDEILRLATETPKNLFLRPPASTSTTTSAFRSFLPLISLRSGGNSDLEILVDCVDERRLRDCADDGLHLLAVLEDHYGRDASDAVLRGDVRRLVGIELHLYIYIHECVYVRGQSSSGTSRVPMS